MGRRTAGRGLLIHAYSAFLHRPPRLAAAAVSEASGRPVRHYPTNPSSSSPIPIFFMSVVSSSFGWLAVGGEIIRCGAGGVVYRFVGVRSYLDNMIFLAALSPVLWCGGLLVCGFRGGGASVLSCRVCDLF